MEHSRENLEQMSHINKTEAAEEKPAYTPRPKYQIVLAWIGIALLVVGFLGTCYWMVNY